MTQKKMRKIRPDPIKPKPLPMCSCEWEKMKEDYHLPDCLLKNRKQTIDTSFYIFWITSISIGIMLGLYIGSAANP